MQAENIISMVIEEELEAPNKNAYHPNPLTYMKYQSLKILFYFI